MVRWELYVNFFYSWIIFSLRCHQVEFSVLHWNEYSSQGYSFWKICREKEEKPKPPFLPPLHVALNMHSSLGLAKQYTASVCFWAGALSSPGVLSCGTKGSNKSQHKCKSLQDWGLQEQPEQWRVALVLPQGNEDAWAHHGQSEPLWEVKQLQSSFGLMWPGLLWAVLQHWKNLHIIRKMDKMASMCEWNGVDIGLGAGSLGDKSEMWGIVTAFTAQ